MTEKEKKARARIVEKWRKELNLAIEQKHLIDGMLACIDNKHAACYFIIQDLANNVSPTIICDRYDITPDELRGIGQRSGFYKLRPRQLNGV